MKQKSKPVWHLQILSPEMDLVCFHICQSLVTTFRTYGTPCGRRYLCFWLFYTPDGVSGVTVYSVLGDTLKNWYKWMHFTFFWPCSQVICILILSFPISLNFPSNSFFSAFSSQNLCAYDHLHHPVVYIRGKLRNDSSFLKSLLKLSLWYNL